jgi:pyrroline-5-carboxylate reductase
MAPVSTPAAQPGLAGIGPVWLVGCGRLGQAMLAGWLAAGLPAAALTVITRSTRDLPAGVRQARQPGPDLAPPAAIVLAVKPAQLADVAPALAGPAAGAALVSVLAGVPLARLAAAFPGAAVTRAFPNTAVRIGRSLTLMAGQDTPQAEALMGALGETVWLAEAWFDAAGAVSASGPAFLFAFLEALGRAGEAAGLPAALAARLALGTVAGAAALAASDGRPPAALRAEVASKGGMTEAGLAVLEDGGALTTLLARCVAAAAARSAELGREA